MGLHFKSFAKEACRKQASLFKKKNIKDQINIKGCVIDEQTRCVHYHSALDIIAIKFKCCDTYYPCYYCHKESADHTPGTWKKNEFNTKAILCGMCKHELTITEYLASNNECPNCLNKFNPQCSNHYHFYFQI